MESTCLSRMRPCHVVNERIKGRLRAAERLDAHRRAYLAKKGEERRLMQREGSDARRKGGAVQNAEVLLRLQRKRLDTIRSERVRRRHDLSGICWPGVDLNLRVADDGTSDVREW